MKISFQLCILLLLASFSSLTLARSSSGDYYDTLGLTRSASKDEVRRAYKRLSIKFHPDKNPGDDKAHKRFIDIANAYEVLSDEKKRDIYDRYGEEGLKQDQQGGGGFHDPFDIFSQ